MSSVSTDIAAFVVGVDCEIQSHQFDEVFIFAESELVGEVVGVVLVLLYSGHFAIFVNVAVDSGGDSWQLGNQIH